MKEQFFEQALAWAPAFAVAVAIFLASWFVARLAHTGVHRIAHRTHMHASLTFLLARLARVGLLLLGAITALGTLGVNITGIVAGLGLTGFALGFALKDSISNLLAGVMILIYRPFEPGDRIECAGFIGRVVHVDLRYTELDAEHERVLIPNSKLLTDPIRVLKNRTAEIQI
ncbi:MAG TPA: mechanosensitive ion channel domain-containing protein [Burkholderiales bacterium]|nr:mechanosensitive ion channel domain-containing protein [Burkholderiales bacterium]